MVDTVFSLGSFNTGGVQHLNSSSVFCDIYLRYAERMAAVSFQQTEAKVTKDLALMGEYIFNAQEHANRQAWTSTINGNRTVNPCASLFCKNHLEGGLDLRYMADRYSRGKDFVQQFMAKRQRYVAAGVELCDVHADVLTWQSENCGSGAGFTSSIQVLNDVSTDLPSYNLLFESPKVPMCIFDWTLNYARIEVRDSADGFFFGPYAMLGLWQLSPYMTHSLSCCKHDAGYWTSRDLGAKDQLCWMRLMKWPRPSPTQTITPWSSACCPCSIHPLTGRRLWHTSVLWRTVFIRIPATLCCYMSVEARLERKSS